MPKAVVEQHPLHGIVECLDAVGLLREEGDQAGKAPWIGEPGPDRIQGGEQALAVQVRTAAEHAPQLRAAAEQPAIEKLRRRHRLAPQVVQARFEDVDLFLRHEPMAEVLLWSHSMESGTIWRAARCRVVRNFAVEDRLHA